MKFKTFEEWKTHFFPNDKKSLTPGETGRQIAQQALAKVFG